MSKLVIVESPAKARTIGQYLGKDYTVMATMGHLRDLPKSGKGISEDFSLTYVPIEGREDVIKKLKDAAAKNDEVILATDPDREGEAISWHVAELFEIKDALRVTFNEITKKEVQKAIANPRKLDFALIDSQQARRALDRIVGYEVSPILWKKIKRGLSAGRVQSVALRLICDREEERRAFVPEEYWTIAIRLKRTNGIGEFEAAYFAPEGEKKAQIPNGEAANAIIEKIKANKFTVKSITNTEKKRAPSAPFITSSFQQEASNRLGIAPKRAMSIAQTLYEGVEIEGHGLVGLITYMRTDSTRLSDDAVSDARNFIKGRYGDNYLPKSARVYKTKKSSQDAHEAIRPSYINLPPETVKNSLKPEQHKIYKLIWERFIASQMENAIYETLTIDSISAGEIFRANHTTKIFSGFTAVYDYSKDEETKPLPQLTAGEELSLTKIDPAQHFTKPPARYTEASLIRAMEEQSIGRPSTYAPIISTLTDREYVLSENKSLRPTPLGEVLTGYMKKQFPDIVDVAFTARMEETLDEVERAEKDWKEMLRNFYDGFKATWQKAEDDIANGRLKIPDEETDQVCDECGKPMVIKAGRFGRFLACTGYNKDAPDESCQNTRAISEPTDGFCPLCDSMVLKKKSKKGYTYYGCEKSGCEFITWDTPQKTNCPDCGKTLFRVRYQKVPICENPVCKSFVPEDARGYKKRDESKTENEDSKKPAAKKSTAKKTTAAKKTTTAKKSTTTKKAAVTKKATAKKPAAAKKT